MKVDKMKPKLTLVEYLKKLQRKARNCHGVDFYGKYEAIRRYLESHVYKQVEVGAALKGDGLLTGHGKEHVDDVIDHMCKLLLHDYRDLNIYEVFLLLIAALIHDIGNVGGRTAHEKRIATAIEGCEEFESLDDPTKHYVITIAEAHGGRTSVGDKDTLSVLRREDYLGGECIRTRALAALLRFADELADNFMRFNADMERLGQIPECNRLYHMYSKCLQPVVANGVTLSFVYSMSDHLAKEEFPKVVNDKERPLYLLDEIFNRLMKAFSEMEYCVKHGGGLFHFEGIDSTITVFSSDLRKELVSIPIRIKDSGFPNRAKEFVDLLEEPLKEEFRSGKNMAKYLLDNYANK